MRSDMNQNKEKIQIETVRTDRFSMDYFKFGRGEKPFVIIPGVSVQSVMVSAELIAEAYKLFADDFTVYVFDRRKNLPETYTITEMAVDTAEAFQVLGLKQINLFGTSQGGMIAMVIAISHPKLVEKLVLGSTSAQVKDEEYQTVKKWIDLAKNKDAEGLYLAFGQDIYPPNVYEQSRQILIDTAKTVTTEEMNHFVIIASGLVHFNIIRDLEKIKCPVLVIGDRDDLVLGGQASVIIADHLKKRPDNELYMYEGYGHAAYDTAPDYKERIYQFLV